MGEIVYGIGERKEGGWYPVGQATSLDRAVEIATARVKREWGDGIPTHGTIYRAESGQGPGHWILEVANNGATFAHGKLFKIFMGEFADRGDDAALSTGTPIPAAGAESIPGNRPPLGAGPGLTPAGSPVAPAGVKPESL